MEKNIEWQSLCTQCRDAQMQVMVCLMEFKDSINAYLEKTGDKPTYDNYDILKIYIEYESSARSKLLEYVVAHDLVAKKD